MFTDDSSVLKCNLTGMKGAERVIRKREERYENEIEDIFGIIPGALVIIHIIQVGQTRFTATKNGISIML